MPKVMRYTLTERDIEIIMKALEAVKDTKHPLELKALKDKYGLAHRVGITYIEM